MSVKVGINGFGRIGRHVLRAAQKRSDIEIIAVNDITDAKTLAHLLKYDSAQGMYAGTVKVGDGSITVDGKQVKVLAERDPGKLPWGKLGVDIVVESTGIFRSKDDASKHISGGAKKVVISAPAKDEVDGNFVIGVNDNQYDPSKHHIFTIGSCTTNCLAPVAKVLFDTFGIEKAFMTTTHAYTADQQLVDAPHKDLRRARSAAVSMIPTTTGAARTISKIIPELEGKMDGCAIRVPTPTGSIIDLVAILEKDATVDAINKAMKAAADGPMKGVLEYCTDPIVSIDVAGNPHSSIFDSLSTMASGRMVKVFSWYDNEWGFSSRMVDMLARSMG